MFDRAPLLERSHGRFSSPATRSPQRFPAKLSLARKNDPAEQEADRNAAQVTSGSISHSISQPSIQRKAIEANTPSSGLPAVDAVLRSPGQPLDARARAWMEPLFLRDFSKVRVHTDDKAARSARALNAHAYTFGSHIVFGAGQFAPDNNQSKRLIAHELTHVVQQQSAPRIQRKIAVNRDAIDIGVLLNNSGASQFTKSGAVYSHPGASGSSLYSEILLTMLVSGRTFTIKGDNDLDAQSNLDSHVLSRKGVVDFAAKKKYTFGAGPRMKMNPAYWEKTPQAGWRPKPGVNILDAMNDVNANPKEYAIACKMATTITMVAGSNSNLVRDTGSSDSDWVPGDWGYIKNTKFSNKPEDVGLEGENIIYVGFLQFWGHFTGTNTYRMLNEWFDEVKGWNGGASILSHRDHPTKGLQ